MTKSIADMLAHWRAGSLKEPVTPALLGALEKQHKAREENVLTDPLLTDEQRRLKLNELRRQYREDWSKMRQAVDEALESQADQARRQANPPADSAMLQRMGLLSSVHLPAWQRSSGNMMRDAVAFGEAGDVAGLRLIQRNLGLVSDPLQRSTLGEAVEEQLEELKTDAERESERQAEQLEKQREDFAVGTALRAHNVAAMASNLGPGPNPQVPSSETARPRR
jgi:hypothetical protein